MAKSGKQQTLNVNKTYKLFINGAFPRTESGRYYSLRTPEGDLIANVCRASRKDFRNSVEAARKAQPGWASRTAYNRSQIVYRIAEILQQSSAHFIGEMGHSGFSKAKAQKEFAGAIDAIVYYAGWCDKYQQILSSVNPVSGSYFNFSVPEPTGVVGVIAPESSPLMGIVQSILPSISGGNTVVVLASKQFATTAISFAEIIANSDVPAGVVNILTGFKDELRHHFASHMDVNAIVVSEPSGADSIELEEHAAENMKRTFYHSAEEMQNPDLKFISNLQEIKTTWHPIERIDASGVGY
jgi:acyl-CoA reductase-like NAD-dependent aldehyde dehydrogenase